MTLIWGRGCLCQERLSIASFVTFSIAPPGSSLTHESENSNQLNRSLRPKSLPTATNIPKYSKDEMQLILKAVLETRVPTPTPTFAPSPAPNAFEKPRDKLLKACFLNVYCGKSHMNCYNFCKQCENYNTTAATKESCDKPLKARSLNVYCKNSHINCYNFCQQCEDYSATVGLWELTGFFLPHFFFETRLVSAGSSTSRDMMQTFLSQLRETISKRFFNEVWVTHKCLWILTGERLKGTPRTS